MTVPVAGGTVTVPAGSVMVRPASCAGVSAQVPLPWLVPWFSVAPVGRPAMVMASVSPGSGWTSWALIVRGIAVFAAPLAGPALSDGAWATGSTVTVRVFVVVAMPAVVFRRDRLDREGEGRRRVGRRRNGQPDQLGRRQAPAAVWLSCRRSASPRSARRIS